MKNYILGFAALASLSITACRKIETDGEPFIVEVPGGDSSGGATTGKTVILKGTITSDTTLKAIDNNSISGFVYIENGATITIEKGTTVKADYLAGEASTLIIKRGAKINAVGTADAPIIFTSSNPTPVSGDWGGIALLGKASINANNATYATGYTASTHLYSPEGGYANTQSQAVAGWGDAIAAAAVDDDNSGIMQYCRIEYAGNAYLPNQEINSLTMAAVGSGTTIDHIQVSYAKDDAYEWFGGTVNCRFLIAFKTQDDDFDTDNGYSGSVQFGLIVRDSLIADVSKSESFESDNDGTGTTSLPQTKAVFSNVSAFGPLATINSVGNSNFLVSGGRIGGTCAQIRRGSSISIYNSAFAGYATGILIDAALGNTDKAINDSTLRLRGNAYVRPLGSDDTKFKAIGFTPTNATREAELSTWFTASGNRVITNAYENVFTRPFDYVNPDWSPVGNSPLLTATAVDFTDAVIASRPFITKVTFAGAIAGGGEFSLWHKGWTKFNYTK